MRKHGLEHEPKIGCSPTTLVPRCTAVRDAAECAAVGCVYAYDVAQNAAGSRLPRRAMVPVQVSM